MPVTSLGYKKAGFLRPLKGVLPTVVTTRKKTFFFLIRTSRVFFWKVFKFFAKNRSSRDLFKNEVLGQNFDFRSPHTPLTLGNLHFFCEFPLISHCKLHCVCPKMTKSGTPLGETPLKHATCLSWWQNKLLAERHCLTSNLVIPCPLGGWEK